VEGSGEVRVFANPLPLFQALVRPLHDWVMNVLRRLPTDGTYNPRPLLGQSNLFSFDLKARLFAGRWKWRCLVSFVWPSISRVMDLYSMCFWLSVTRKGTFAQLYVFRFTKGQPLGFYSSWPVFTLTHHMRVWYAAWRVRPGVKFFDYALLGDYIVIADPVVAKSYLEVMEGCKVR